MGGAGGSWDDNQPEQGDKYTRVPIQRDQRSSSSSSTPPIPKNYGFTPSNMGSAAWEGLGNIAESVYGAGKDLVSSKTPVFLSDEKPNAPIAERMQGDTLINKYLLAPAAENEKKALNEADAFHKSHGWDAAGHAASSLAYTGAEYLPLVGSIAAHLGERAGTGDIGGALAEGGTYAVAPKIAEKALTQPPKTGPSRM